MNLEYKVTFYGPDEDGLYYARIGKYIVFFATSMDGDKKEQMRIICNEKANFINTLADNVVIRTFVPMYLNKRDIGNGIVRNQTSMQNIDVLAKIVKEDLMMHLF